VEFQHSPDDDRRLHRAFNRNRPGLRCDACFGHGEHEFELRRDLILGCDCHRLYDGKRGLLYEHRWGWQQSRIDIDISGYRLRNGLQQPFGAELFQSGPLCDSVFPGEHASDSDSYTDRHINIWKLDRM